MYTDEYEQVIEIKFYFLLHNTLVGVSKGMLHVEYLGWGKLGHAPCRIFLLGVIKGMLHVEYFFGG